MNNIQWELTINRDFYPYKQDWLNEDRNSELSKIKCVSRVLYFDEPNLAVRFFFDKIVKHYEKKYKNFLQCWIDIDSYSFSEKYDYEIVDYVEYRPSYIVYDFELSMCLKRVDVKRRLAGVERFKNEIGDGCKLKDDESHKITCNEVWELMQKHRLWS